MFISTIINQFIQGIQQTGWLEFTAVIAGISSVWFSRKENILVYPVGLINTIIYIYLSIKGNLFGEASVNLYYTIMSIYGWILWTRKDQQTNTIILQVRFSSQKEWIHQLAFFSIFYITIFTALTWLKQSFAPEAIPWADAFASATAYTGMWLMARKKVESWIWWIATNIASIPLYFVKGYVFTSVQFMVLFILAVAGYISWYKRQNMQSIKKIVILGPESTGKSSLCELLAKHYKTEWCREYAREYLLTNGTNYTVNDLLLIAKGQLALEEEILRIVDRSWLMDHGNKTTISYEPLTINHPLVFIDTDLYVMKVWSEYVFGSCDFFILDQIVKRKYDGYLLCDIDLPWVKDKLREYPDEKPRQELFGMYKDLLINQSTPFAIISGTYEERLAAAIRAVDGWVN